MALAPLRPAACSLLLTAAMVLGAAGASAAPAGNSRLYLAASESGDGYWTVDPHDPELSTRTVLRTCGVDRSVEQTAPCQSYWDPATGLYHHTVDFYPASVVDEQRMLNGPTTFSLALDVASPAPYGVSAFLREDLDRVTGTATQTAPGVWQGTIDDRTPLRGTVNVLGFFIQTASPTVKITLAGAGRSWFELPEPVALRAVPQLQRQGAYEPAPMHYEGAGRRLRFNDGEWSAFAFSGDLREGRSFRFALPRDAEIVVAWVEAFDTPLVYDVLRGRGADERKLRNSPNIGLRRDGEVVGAGSNHGERGRGEDSLAALDVPAGPLELTVRPSSWDPAGAGSDFSFTAHVVAVYGERTLHSMRWRFGQDSSMRLPAVASCPWGAHPVPVTDRVTTFLVDLDWDTEARPAPSWTLGYELPTVGEFPCGEATVGDTIRFTLPSQPRVWVFGPAPAEDGTYVAWNDTLFDMTVTYTYAAADVTT